MSEKRGETVKLIDNYNTAGVLEVKMGKTWYRTTSKDLDPLMDLEESLSLRKLGIET